MKNNLYGGKGLLCPESLLFITIKKEKPILARPLIPAACEAFNANHLNISDKNTPCHALVPIPKPATALLPATLLYK